MTTIQVIALHGRPVALALGENAIIANHVTGQERSIVAGMALYALEIHTGQPPGPYTGADAEHYARHAIALRRTHLTRVRRGAHPPSAARS